jgi:tRNA nucleotidyltransferase (CCA-adding enzyme)
MVSEVLDFRKKEEGRRKKEEGRRKKEEGRRKTLRLRSGNKLPMPNSPH